MKEQVTKQQYKEINKALEDLNKEYIELLNSKTYKLGDFFYRLFNTLKTFNFRSVRGFFRNIKWKIRRNRYTSKFVTKNTDSVSCNEYFSNDKIAVYTCIFGDYDDLQEPLIKPDNIDYYVITDQDVPENSLWKSLDWYKYCESSFSNIEKNRFFKMHPNVIFKEYKYSIYVDGNIKIINDLTPLISRLNKYGLALHSHSERNCSYIELKAILYTYKAKKKEIAKYYNYLLNNGLTKDYGLCECNVIVRENKNSICIKIMNDWRYEFKNNFKRDQVSLPLVLYKNNISVDDVSTLGENVYKNYSFRIINHN